MRFINILSTLSVFASGVSAVAPPNTSLATKSALLNINAGNCWGAPIPPWEDGCHPGWYYGRKEYAPTGLLCLVDDLVCFVLDLLGIHICPIGLPPIPPPCPPVGPSPPLVLSPKGYTLSFCNLTCAAEVWPPQYYLTYGIVETIQGCANMCDSIPNCKWANSYHDNNAGPGKNNTTLLTCSIFSIQLTAANATNCGGQQQKDLPAGTTTITQSYGLKKIGAN